MDNKHIHDTVASQQRQLPGMLLAVEHGLHVEFLELETGSKINHMRK